MLKWWEFWMRLLFNIALVITTLLVVDAFGFRGKYRHMVGRELLSMNPFKHTPVHHAQRSATVGR
jgi:hypothetical protein